MFLENLKLIYTLLIIFACSWGANSILGINLNVFEIKEKFDIKRLINSLVKAVFLLLSLLLMTVAISYLPEILLKADITIISEDAINNLTLLTIITILVSGCLKYLGQAIEKLRILLNLTEEDLIELKYEKLANDDKEIGELIEEEVGE